MLFLLILLLIPFSVYKLHKTDEGMWLFSIPLTFIGLITVTGIAEHNKFETHRDNYEVPIFSLKVNTELHGNFFLGTGSINSNTQYYYYVKDDRGGYIINNSSIYNTVLFETNKEEPNVSWQKIYYDVSRWLVPWNPTSSEDTKYDLTVPVGTIVKEYHGF